MSRYIEADAFKEDVKHHLSVLAYAGSHAIKLGTLEQWLDNAPSIDIVRCQDCKYWVYNFNGCARNPCTEPWYATDFCNYGEREGE